MRKVKTTTTYYCDICGKKKNKGDLVYDADFPIHETDKDAVIHALGIEIRGRIQGNKATADICKSCLRRYLQQWVASLSE